MANRDDEMVTFTVNLSSEEAERLAKAAERGEAVTLSIPLKVTGEIAETLTDILTAPDEADMVELLEIAGLDPAKDLTHHDFSGAKWGPHDLTGYDLTGCNLAGCDFSEAVVDEMIYTDATIDDVVWPEGYIPYNGPSVRH